MKKLLMIMATIFVGMIVNSNAQFLARNVGAFNCWTDTGISVTNGQVLTINANGRWDIGDSLTIGPDGTLGYFGIVGTYDEFLGNNIAGSLVAYVGSNAFQGQWTVNNNFFPQTSGYWEIGSSRQFTSPANGNLWLGINDDSQTLQTNDNAGSVTAYVSSGYGATNGFDCGPVLCDGVLTNLETPLNIQFSFSITGTANTFWGVYASSDLVNWVLVNTVTLDSTGAGTFVNPTDVPYRFYKLDNGMCHSKAIGFVQITVPATNSLMIADQLLSCPGPGSNTVEVVLPSVPEGTVLLKYNEGLHHYDTNTFTSGSWAYPTMTLNPGEGAFIHNPTTNAITITFTGIVPEGHLVNELPYGTYIRSSIVPQAGPIASFLEYPATDNHSIVQWNAATQSYSSELYVSGSWYGDGNVEPIIRVGEAFWVENGASSTNWIRDFTIWRSLSP